jgi:hypothetical protein
MRAFARAGALGVLLAVASAYAGCHLDLANKNACVTDTDCTDGRVCVQAVCTSVEGGRISDDAATSSYDGGPPANPEGGCDFSSPAPFPSTPVLDTFASGSALSNWTGAGIGSYFVADGGLVDPVGNTLLWGTPFGPDQEAFVTIDSYDPMVYQMSLLLDAQDPTSPDVNAISVSYLGITSDIRVVVREHGHSTSLEPNGGLGYLYPGTEIGARVRQGCIEVFINRQLVGTADATNVGYVGLGGSIGVFSQIQQNPDGGGQPSVWSTFGGGDLSGGGDQ